VNEQVSFGRSVASGLARPGIRRIDKAPPGSRGPNKIFRLDLPAIWEHNVLAAMKATEERTHRHPRRPRLLHIESTKAIRLNESKTERRCRVVRSKSLYQIVLKRNFVSGLEARDHNRKPEVIATNLQCILESSLGARRTMDGEICGSSLQTHGPKQSRKTQIMVRVHMRDEDVANVEPDGKAHHLALGSFTTVEQMQVALSLDSQRGNATAYRGAG
jgi:hypothetical protein